MNGTSVKDWQLIERKRLSLSLYCSWVYLEVMDTRERSGALNHFLLILSQPSIYDNLAGYFASISFAFIFIFLKERAFISKFDYLSVFFILHLKLI